jgi:hypothetical protein
MEDEALRRPAGPVDTFGDLALSPALAEAQAPYLAALAALARHGTTSLHQELLDLRAQAAQIRAALSGTD